MAWTKYDNLPEYQQRTLRKYEENQNHYHKGQIVFVGSSLMEMFDIETYTKDMPLSLKCYNRAVSGFISADLKTYLKELVLDLAPQYVYINIGTNDIGKNLIEDLFVNYKEMIEAIRRCNPSVKITIWAYYPCNEVADFGLPSEKKERNFRYRTAKTIASVNERLKAFAQDLHCDFMDLNTGLYDEDGRLRKELSLDGIHMNDKGNAIIFNNLKAHLLDTFGG